MMTWAKHAIALAALCASGAALAENSGWVISEADGQVSINRDGKSVYGAKGTALQVGDVVRTSKAARAVLVKEKNFRVLKGGEQVRVVKEEEAGVFSSMLQAVGSLFTGSDQHSNLKTRPMASVVKGWDKGASGFGGAAPSDGAQTEAEETPAEGS